MNCHVPFRLGSSRALLCITAIFQLFLLVTCPFESHFRLLELPLICSAWSSLAGHGWQACLQRSFRDSRCDATLQVPDPAFLKKGYEFVQKSLLCRTRWCSHAAVALYKIWIKKSNTVFFPWACNVYLESIGTLRCWNATFPHSPKVTLTYIWKLSECSCQSLAGVLVNDLRKRIISMFAMQQSQGPARKAPSNSRGMCRNPAQAPWNLNHIELHRIAMSSHLCLIDSVLHVWFEYHCTRTTQQARSFSWVSSYRLRMTQV